MLFSKLFYPSLSYWYQPLLFALWCFGNLKVKFAKVQKCEVKIRVTFYDFLVPKIWLCG